jgi:hypothetical protein
VKHSFPSSTWQTELQSDSSLNAVALLLSVQTERERAYVIHSRDRPSMMDESFALIELCAQNIARAEKHFNANILIGPYVRLPNDT